MTNDSKLMTTHRLCSKTTESEQVPAAGSHRSVWKLTVFGGKAFTAEGTPTSETDTLKAKRSLLMLMINSRAGNGNDNKPV